MPRIGRLNKRVAFEAEIRTPDGQGGFTRGWQPVIEVWGNLMVERGRERVEAGRLESAVAGVLSVRSSSQTRSITTDHRVIIDGVPHQIRSRANPDQRNRFIEFVVERGVAT